MFLERGEGREREGEKHQCVASRAPPTGDLACNTGMCPNWELNQWPCASQAGTQSTEPHQPGLSMPSSSHWLLPLPGSLFLPPPHLPIIVADSYALRSQLKCHLLLGASMITSSDETQPSSMRPHSFSTKSSWVISSATWFIIYNYPCWIKPYENKESKLFLATPPVPGTEPGTQ